MEKHKLKERERDTERGTETNQTDEEKDIHPSVPNHV